jgi:hypothetical protein
VAAPLEKKIDFFCEAAPQKKKGENKCNGKKFFSVLQTRSTFARFHERCSDAFSSLLWVDNKINTHLFFLSFSLFSNVWRRFVVD